MRHVFNFLALLFAAATGGLYWFVIANSLFWRYPWYDIPLHLLAGMAIGSWAGGVAAKYKFTLGEMFLLAFFLALGVGTFWELFEYSSGITRGEPGYWLDTTKDLFNACVGTLPAVALYWFVYRKRDYHG
ncbi:MAG TPA: hypothetical protein VG934_01155 [Candidatus Paceibacterota bacterium]|nr:hypothetical protein [Candidatus Paceibacterota bacterium]